MPPLALGAAAAAAVLFAWYALTGRRPSLPHKGGNAAGELTGGAPTAAGGSPEEGGGSYYRLPYGAQVAPPGGTPGGTPGGQSQDVAPSYSGPNPDTPAPTQTITGVLPPPTGPPTQMPTGGGYIPPGGPGGIMPIPGTPGGPGSSPQLPPPVFQPPPPAGGCFTADTLVETPDGTVPIVELEPGAAVVSVNGQRVVGKVARVFRHEGRDERPVLRCVMASGAIVRGTGEHMVATPLGFEPLARAAALMRPDGTFERIVERWPEPPVAVYNLELEAEPRTYLAGGFVVHNVKLSGSG